MTQAAVVRDTGLAPESLVHLFKVLLEFTSDSASDAVLPAERRDGAYIGSGDGTVTGDRVGGTMSWSLYAGDCLYPRIRKGEAVPDDLHLCTLNPRGFIKTHDGAQIRFDGRGYGLRTRDWYRLSAALTFATDAVEYRWLTEVLAVMEGDFDEKAGRQIWHVYVPDSTVP
jgi:hypothetical protein